MSDRARYLANQWVNVDSSWIQSVRWNPEGGRLDVLTRKGKTLSYAGCDAITFGAFLHAASKGSFLNAIKHRLTYLG